jgi:hypothetical protein
MPFWREVGKAFRAVEKHVVRPVAHAVRDVVTAPVKILGRLVDRAEYKEAPQRVQEACALIREKGVVDAQVAGYSAEEIAHANRILALG